MRSMEHGIRMPQSRAHYDRQCHFSMRKYETALFLLQVWNLTVGMVIMPNLVAVGQPLLKCGDVSRLWPPPSWNF